MLYISLQQVHGHILSKTPMLINSYCNIVDLAQSTTALAPNVPFNFSYGSGDVVGDYISDNIAVGGANLTAVIIGVASEDTNEQRGILGVGLPAGETPDVLEHAGVLELLVSQGYISSASYSLYLDSYSKLSLDSSSLISSS
jgi:Eukaryotic aspartyl protease